MPNTEKNNGLFLKDKSICGAKGDAGGVSMGWGKIEFCVLFEYLGVYITPSAKTQETVLIS